MEKLVKNVNVIVENGELKDEEIVKYIDYVTDENPGRRLETLKLTLDGEYVDMEFEFAKVNFERIRRIR